LLLVAGCGRFAFEAGPDAKGIRTCVAPVGHDEDGDGVDDACDGCPHIADPDQPNSDGDGVDDACDPRPDVAGDSIVFFDPFEAADPSWMIIGSVGTFADDAVHFDSRNMTRYILRKPHVSSDDTFILGGQIGDAIARRQLIVGVHGEGAVAYYCELEGPTTSAKLAATYTPDGVAYTILARSDGPPLQNGAFELTLRDAYPTIGCATTWDVPVKALDGTLPGGLTATLLNIELGSMEGRLDYFVQIHSE
jgi:hypothetical protein